MSEASLTLGGMRCRKEGCNETLTLDAAAIDRETGDYFIRCPACGTKNVLRDVKPRGEPPRS